MSHLQSDSAYGTRVRLFFGRGALLPVSLVAVAVGLSACGSTRPAGTSKSAKAPALTSTRTTAKTTVAAVDPSPPPTSAKRPDRRTAGLHKPKPRAALRSKHHTRPKAPPAHTSPTKTAPTRTVATHPSRTTDPPRTTKAPTTRTQTATVPQSGLATIPATSISPAYVGISPLECLRKAGLSNPHPGVEAGVWLATVPGGSAKDSNAIVLLSGPYPNDSAATKYANSLTAVPELGVAGGRWVASASVRSKLGPVVQSVASCMKLGA